MRVRRVVTGQAADGTSILVSDEQLEPITVDLLPGAGFHSIWGSDATATLPTDGTPPRTQGYYPPAAGFRFGLFTMPPLTVGPPAELDIAAAMAQIQARLPGMLDVFEAENPGMHCRDTVDFVLVISGEVWLELDDGAEVHLGQGDCVVQNGTRHAWRNRSTAPCVMAFAAVGAQRTA